jgi:hypothetical protein
LTSWAGEALTSLDFRQGSDHLVCFETAYGRAMESELDFPVAFISLGISFPKELECWSPIDYDLESVRLRAEPCMCFVDTSDSEGDGHAPQRVLAVLMSF